MAALSDQLLMVAILAYLVAMVCHAAEYAFGARAPWPGSPPGRAVRSRAGRRRARQGVRDAAGARVRPPPAADEPPAALGPSDRIGGRGHRARRRGSTSPCWSPGASPPTGCRGATCTSSCSRVTLSAWRLAGRARPASVDAPPRAVRHAGHGAAARRRRHGALHPGRAAGAGAELVLVHHPRLQRPCIASGIFLLGFVAGGDVPDAGRVRPGQAALPVHPGRAAAGRPRRWSG